MFSILEEVSRRMIEYVEEKGSKDNMPLEAREVCVRYTLDNVAACAFGLEGNCFKESYPMFRKLADDFLSPGTWQSIKASIIFLLPPLAKILKLK